MFPVVTASAARAPLCPRGAEGAARGREGEGRRREEAEEEGSRCGACCRSGRRIHGENEDRQAEKRKGRGKKVSPSVVVVARAPRYRGPVESRARADHADMLNSPFSFASGPAGVISAV